MNGPVVSWGVGGGCSHARNSCAGEQSARLNGGNVVAQIAQVDPMILVERVIYPDKLLLEIVGVAEERRKSIGPAWQGHLGKDVLDVLLGHRIELGDLLCHLIA